MNKYFGVWGSREAVVADLGSDVPSEEDIIVAGYSAEGYEGSATVIFRCGPYLYEVESSHCSCNGLEWGTPARATPEYLANRAKHGSFWGLSADGIEALQAFLEMTP